MRECYSTAPQGSGKRWPDSLAGEPPLVAREWLGAECRPLCGRRDVHLRTIFTALQRAPLVLVVDRNTGFLRRAALALRSKRFDVFSFSDVGSLERYLCAGAREPQLIVFGLDSGGAEELRKLEQILAGLPDVPLLLLTTHGARRPQHFRLGPTRGLRGCRTGRQLVAMVHEAMGVKSSDPATSADPA